MNEWLLSELKSRNCNVRYKREKSLSRLIVKESKQNEKEQIRAQLPHLTFFTEKKRIKPRKNSKVWQKLKAKFPEEKSTDVDMSDLPYPYGDKVEIHKMQGVDYGKLNDAAKKARMLYLFGAR